VSIESSTSDSGDDDDDDVQTDTHTDQVPPAAAATELQSQDLCEVCLVEERDARQLCLVVPCAVWTTTILCVMHCTGGTGSSIYTRTTVPLFAGFLYRPKPIHCNYQLVRYSVFCRISPSILNRFKPNLQA